MVLPDYPITSRDNDLLRRTSLADKIAELILKFNAKDSFVIGVEGLWGSGKTSFVNLVQEALRDKVICFRFNPWNFADQNSLLYDFFIKLSELLESSSREVKKKGVKKKILNYVSKLSVLDVGVSAFGLGTSIRPLAFLKRFSSDTSLEVLRNEINEITAALDKKVIIIIDDIDRLDANEVKLVLKLVKLTADFPNVIFLLPYDRNVIESKISDEKNGVKGEEYLKKIIQVSFLLPDPDEEYLRKILYKDLGDSLLEIYGTDKFEGNNQGRWENLSYAGFTNLFKTIRDIKKYISSLRLDWSIMGPHDVNQIDFIGISAIRVFAPKFYSAIKANKSLFTGSNYGLSLRADNSEKIKEIRYQDLLNLIPDTNLRACVNSICKELFPQLNFNSHYGSDWAKEWTRDLRICSQERFDFYFQLGVPYGEISESEIDAILQDLNDVEAFKKTIEYLYKEEKLRTVLHKIIFKLGKMEASQIEALILTLWDLETVLKDEKKGVFDMDDLDTQTTRLAFNAIKDNPKISNKIQFIIKLFKATTGLYLPIRLIYLYLKETPNISENESDIKDLKNMAVERIEKQAAEGKLINQRHLHALLYRWRDWTSEAKVTEFIDSVVKDRATFLALMRAFVSRVLSTDGNRNAFSRTGLGGIYPIEKIEAVVNSISEDEMTKMSPEDREAINLFKNPKEDY